MNTETTTPALKDGSRAMFAFVRAKLAVSEQSLRCREAMAAVKPISPEEFERLSKTPGARVTKGRRLSKAEIKDMKEPSLRHGQIAVKCREEVKMFKALLDFMTRSVNEAGAKDL